ILDRIAYIVDEMAGIQAHRGDGYVAAIPGGDSLWQAVAAGQIEASGFRLNGVWAPWYTLHKQFAGLLDAYGYTGNEQALAVARRLANWAIATTDGLSEADWQRMLACEYGGMNEAMANLYAVTGEEKYLTLSRQFHDLAVLHPLAEGVPNLTGLHANTQIPKVIGVARQYEIIGDDSLKTIANFFWQQMVDEHSYVIGGNSMGEYLGEPGELADRLDATTAETCNTYNMLRLTRHQFRMEPKARYGDYYERALYNHILASQEPNTGMFTYYMSLKPGHYKTYSTPEGAFWCCVGSGMENHVRYGDAIYFHAGSDLYVNLFIASELEWLDQDVHIRQETQFPNAPSTRLLVSTDAPKSLRVHVRHPSWAKGALEVQINGEPHEVASSPGSFLVLERTWQDGDTVDIIFPMKLRAEAMPDNPARVALLYGPIVLGGVLGTQDMPEGGAFADSDVRYIEEPTPDVPVLVADLEALETWVQPIAGDPLTFHTVGVGRPQDVILKPFYRIHNERYSIYWDVFDEAGWQAAQQDYQAARERQRAIDEATVDVMRLGEMLGEQEHRFEGEHIEKGVAFGKKYREARRGGWFAFDIAIPPEHPAALLCTYWGGDRGRRTFDILVNDTKIATQSLDNETPGSFFEVAYEVPALLTEGKSSIRVRFQAHEGNTAGRVFGCKSLTVSKDLSLDLE
ncbi:MAG TPA: beta-L-arabinofuranosidase domain-containing protein, partial [Rhodothermales bacterium]|nr:beta-L-arabinofuranosidase domain-containing protein [Rhodothermales bacterium]